MSYLVTLVKYFSWKAAYEKTTEAKDSALYVFRETINEMIKKAPELGEDYLLSEKVYNKFLH